MKMYIYLSDDKELLVSVSMIVTGEGGRFARIYIWALWQALFETSRERHD
jgi:hypothetical protein